MKALDSRTYLDCMQKRGVEKKGSFWRLNWVWKTLFLPICLLPSVVKSCVSAEKSKSGSSSATAFCSLPVQTRAKRLFTVMQNQARLTKYNQNNLPMTTSPDIKTKPQLVQVNYLHSCRYVHSYLLIWLGIEVHFSGGCNTGRLILIMLCRTFCSFPACFIAIAKSKPLHNARAQQPIPWAASTSPPVWCICCPIANYHEHLADHSMWSHPSHLGLRRVCYFLRAY